MMELTCAYILLLFSLVCATPHGYGTKGGASAKAEASASAGAFGDLRGLPLSIPSGSGFSGSYSKSSSSSYSSASSSASSSSSSFSYSGSGAAGLHGFGANNVAGANLGCGTGSCSNNKIDGLSSQHGSDVTAYSNAKAAAESKAIAGTIGSSDGNCGSGLCSNNNNHGTPGTHGFGTPGSIHGYNGGNAAAGSQSGISTNNHANGGCGSGSCSNKNANGPDASGSDQEYNEGNAAGGSNSAAGSNYETGTHNYPNEACGSAGCSSKNPNGIPSAHGSAKPDSVPSYNNANSRSTSINKVPGWSSFGSNDIPAKKIETKFDFNGYNGGSSPNCAHGNCGLTNGKPTAGVDSQNPSGSPDKYNQVHGVPKCDTPYCNGYDSTGPTVFPSSGFGPTKPATYLTTPKAGANCNSPGCEQHLSTGKPSSYNVPLHSSIGLPKENQPGSSYHNNPYPASSGSPSGPAGPITCTSANCGKHPTPSTSPDCKSPNCAPNFGSASTGTGSGISYQPGTTSSVPVSAYPNYASSVIPSYKPSEGHSNSGCKTPDCFGYTPGNPNAGNGFSSHPSGSGPGHIAPSYSTPVVIPSTPSVGHGSSNCQTPNCVPHSPINSGHYGSAPTAGTTTEHKEPTVGYVGGFGGPSGVLKPNEFSGPTNPHLTQPHLGSPKPSVEAHPPAEELPPYTGGFGGPTGILKPNEFDFKHPSTSAHTPGSSASPSGSNQPSYTGGFGAPTGLLKPNEFSNSGHPIAGSVGPSLGPIPTPGQYPSTPNNGFTYTPGMNTIVGVNPVVHPGTPVVLQPIPASYPSHVLPSVAPIITNPALNPNVAPGHAVSHGHTNLGIGTSPDKNLPAYTGSFGGAPGILKPNENNDLSSNNYNKPATVSNVKPTSCSSGSCGVEAGNAVAVAKADAVAYTGGFGGPPGFLKPHDGGKFDSKLLSAGQIGINHGSSGNAKNSAGLSSSDTHEDGTKPHSNGAAISSGATAQAVAQASASAGAAAGTFSGNDHSGSHVGVDGHKSGSGCGGGCGSGSYHSPDFGSSSALSVAKAGVLDGADAKGHASAISGARAFGGAGSYASSSASAHASAGYATKGGYGK